VHFRENLETCNVLIILASRSTAANVKTLKTFKMYGNDVQWNRRQRQTILNYQQSIILCPSKFKEKGKKNCNVKNISYSSN
jgi:hypothetical protein